VNFVGKRVLVEGLYNTLILELKQKIPGSPPFATANIAKPANGVDIYRKFTNIFAINHHFPIVGMIRT
jgi:hypothetical protein